MIYVQMGYIKTTKMFQTAMQQLDTIFCISGFFKFKVMKQPNMIN